ncbi:EscU/YscU/HrcU family type III secretion system export apparatus switch protein [Undibacterium seohonense]|jgi:flagellar biosynthesis protein|uniref:EscU/YscU/HrcU family type III secretion system export apparatus switch protein n=1 Tax=Undibacterium seohonense TaxID=1344950 RepID=A0ABR6X7Y3_9BURK|nr:EscU/YscU/HrcU family type III secretion system export apparatus switch protein [Undibacterium seohonense]MBC3809060.1 EscU/YscU/HrcU family type III secretion system export apparatus switch protein [Undibacterium seohonense]
MNNSKVPPLSAVALSYGNDDPAPKVVAKGRGLVAEEIIKRAKDSGVFIHQSKELVTLLMKVDLDDAIPPELYRVVAELLAWLYHIESELNALSTPTQPP